MANVRLLKNSFIAGELSPLVLARFDVEKVNAGLAKCLNFIVTPQGAIENRQGTQFVWACKSEAAGTSRLLQFSFSTTQNFAIELGAGYFRFYALGSVILAGSVAAWNAGTAYAIGNMAALGGTNYYCIAANTGNAPPNSGYWYAMPATGEYEIPNPYAAADIATINYVESGDVITLVHPNYPPMELSRYGNTDWVLSVIGFSSVYPPPATVTAVATYAYTTGTYPQHFTYQVCTVDPLGNESSLASVTSAVCVNDLSAAAANYNTITWTAATPPAGAAVGAYNIYKATNGGAFGFIGQVPPGSLTFVDNNITADYTKTPSLNDVVFNSANNYPSAVCYFQQRRWFAGTNNTPNGIWATQSGTGSNMNYSIPSQDSDALRVTIAAQRANKIAHLTPISGLIAFSSSTDWLISAGAVTTAITPSTFSDVPQSQNGASPVAPVALDNYVIYPAYQGGHIYEMAWDWESQTFPSADICLLAHHLFDGQTIVATAFSRAPIPIFWAVNSNGQLLGMTYIPKQEISAWHQHNLAGGFVESVVTVTENGLDSLYLIVRRVINGATVRLVEVLALAAFTSQANCFYVDCGVTVNTGAPVTTVSGLNWLAGTAVSVLADGVPIPNITVSATGTVTLPWAATVVQIGLAYNSDALVGPMAVQGTPDLGLSHTKSVDVAYVGLVNSGPFKIGPNANQLLPVFQDSYDDPSVAPPLVTGELSSVLANAHSPWAQVLIRQDLPLPLTVTYLVVKESLGG